MDLHKAHTIRLSLAEQTLHDEENGEALLRENQEKERIQKSVVNRLIRPFINAADQALTENR